MPRLVPRSALAYAHGYYRAAIAVLLLVPAQWAGAGALQDAGETARVYMTAMLQGDFKTVVQLMDEAVLLNLKMTFTRLIDQATADGKEAEVLKTLRVKTRAEAMNLSIEEVSVRMLSSQPVPENYYAEMKRARIEVANVEAAGPDGAKAHLLLFTPSGSGFHKQEAAIVLRQTGGKWKVMGTDR
jgi:hypothetical protein